MKENNNLKNKPKPFGTDYHQGYNKMFETVMLQNI